MQFLLTLDDQICFEHVLLLGKNILISYIFQNDSVCKPHLPICSFSIIVPIYDVPLYLQFNETQENKKKSCSIPSLFLLLYYTYATVYHL